MSRKYSVSEMFPTLQGEGKWAGRAAVFLRMSGCNLWNGKPADRSKGRGACAMWCDTDFSKGQTMSLVEVLARAEGLWERHAKGPANKMVVITGGEPMLQVDDDMLKAFSTEGWFTAVETNGTVENDALDLVDHVCLSPKLGSNLKVWGAHELKVVLPGGVPGAPPDHHWDEDALDELRVLGEWGALYVQPQDVTDPTTVELSALTMARRPDKRHVLGVDQAMSFYDRNLAMCVDFVQRHPEWRLSLQQHKMIGMR